MIQKSEFLQSLRPEFEPGVAGAEAAPGAGTGAMEAGSKAGMQVQQKTDF